MVARRYEYYFRVVKTIFYERAQRVSKVLFLTRRVCIAILMSFDSNPLVNTIHNINESATFMCRRGGGHDRNARSI